MICVQVVKGVLQSFPLQNLLLITGCHQKLSEINQPRAIGIHNFQNLFDLLLAQGALWMVIEHKQQLILSNNSITVLVHIPERLQKFLLIFVWVQLWGNVSVDYSLEFVLKLLFIRWNYMEWLEILADLLTDFVFLNFCWGVEHPFWVKCLLGCYSVHGSLGKHLHYEVLGFWASFYPDCT